MIEEIKKINPVALYEITENTRQLVELYNNIGGGLSAKQLSEMISGIVETSYANVGRKMGFNVVTPKVDSEPDLYIDGVALEIKTKSMKSGSWRGGEFSKRGGFHLFITYNINESTGFVDEWFVIFKWVDKSEWKSGGKNYYGTTIALDSLLNGGIILYGDIVKKTKLRHPVPLPLK